MPHRGGAWNSSPPLLSPPLLIILLPILTITLLFLTVPPLLSATTNLLQHTSSVKTSWNSLNILLVVLAILFGVFARRNDDEEPSTPHQTTNNAIPDQNDTFRRNSLSSEGTGTSGYESQQWFGFSSEESKVFDETSNRLLQSPVISGVTRMRRSSSSYPDLRQMETGDNSYKFRFFDDYEIEKHFRSPARATFSVSDHRIRLPEEKEEQVHVKEIPVDTFEVRPSSSSPVKSTIPPPPAPPPPVSALHHPNQIHRRVESSNEITKVEDPEFTRINTPPAVTTVTPPPSPPRLSVKTRSERKKSNVKREIAMVWASVLSNQRKRKKKQKPKNDHNNHYDSVEELKDNATAPPVTMTPPPPPPPPPSVFHSIFRKSNGKSKKIHSVPAPPPPSSKRSSRPKKQIPPPPPTPPPAQSRRRSHTKPPLPNKSSNFINETVETFNAGSQSPLIPVPPPLPPFKMPAMKFAVRGDFVKIRSNQSSRSTSPEREHIDVEVTETIAVVNHSSDVTGPVFCPSPDVNAKAATFIARLRGEWRLQKLNSIKEKGNGSLPHARD